MSYCISAEERRARGFCDPDLTFAREPTVIRETIIEPVFDYGFVGPHGGIDRWRGSGGIRRVPDAPWRRESPSWQPRSPSPRRLAGGGVDRPSRSPGPASLVGGSMTVTRREPSPGTVFRPATVTRREVAPASPGAVFRPTTVRPTGLKGLGQATDGVSPRWKYAAMGLGALVVAQFFWWNAKAPQVLRLGW